MPNNQPVLKENTLNIISEQNMWEERRRRLLLLVGFRTIILSGLLISTIVAHARASTPAEILALVPLYTVAGLSFLANLIYAVIFKFKAPVLGQVVTQLAGDLLFAAAILYFTGGVQSAFSFFFLLTAINGAVILARFGSLTLATAAALIYLAEIILQYNGILVPPISSNNGSIGLMVYLNAALVHTFSIYMVTLLTIFLSEQANRAHHTAIAVSHDLSKLKEFHLAVLQNLPVGVITLNSQDQVVFVNNLAKLMCEDEKLEIGQELKVIFSEELNGYSEGKVITTGREDGAEALLVRFSPLMENDKTLGHIITLQDVSTVQQMERQLHQKERLASLGELAAGMAHEIRNPLASVRGSIELLARRLPKEGAEQGLINIAVREIDRLNSLISDFLTYARPQKINLSPCDISQLCRETVALLQNDLPAYIKLAVLGSQHITINADGAKLRQVIWNLLKNSIDACNDAMEHKIIIDLAETADTLSIIVKDDGAGITKEQLKHLFVPFFSTKSQGSGLGLAIVGRIIEEHSGTIQVQSTPGNGATFILNIPKNPG